jgi:hypothetical protein
MSRSLEKDEVAPAAVRGAHDCLGTGCELRKALSFLEVVGEPGQSYNLYVRSMRANIHCEQTHPPPSSAPHSSAAVAVDLGAGEKRLRDEKLAISSAVWLKTQNVPSLHGMIGSNTKKNV